MDDVDQKMCLSKDMDDVDQKMCLSNDMDDVENDRMQIDQSLKIIHNYVTTIRLFKYQWMSGNHQINLTQNEQNSLYDLLLELFNSVKSLFIGIELEKNKKMINMYTNGYYDSIYRIIEFVIYPCDEEQKILKPQSMYSRMKPNIKQNGLIYMKIHSNLKYIEITTQLKNDNYEKKQFKHPLLFNNNHELLFNKLKSISDNITIVTTL